MTDYDGSTPLEEDNGKAEKYARFRAAGNTQVDSYVHIGRANDDGHASRYENAGDGRIRKRIQYLNATAAERLGITPEKIAAKLVKLMNEAERDSDKIKAMENLSKHIGFYEADNLQKVDNKFNKEEDVAILERFKNSGKKD